MFLGNWDIDDYLTFTACTHDSGEAADADAVPSYAIYEDETAVAIVSGNMAKLGVVTGFYTERVQLTAANGFEAGKCYAVRVEAVMGGVTAAAAHSFAVKVTSANVTTWAGVATTSNERDAMNRLYDMIGTGLGQRYFNSMALQQVKNSIGLAAANLDTQLSTIDGIVDALALVAPDNQPIVNADGETLAYMTALSEEEIAAAVIVALQETPVEVICVTPQPSQESDYDILRNNATNC